MMSSDTIVAQCTPQGPGAIALIRLSGPDSIAIVSHVAFLPHHKKLADQQTHTIHYGFVLDHKGEHIDQVLFLIMRGPQTFTGEDTVEITCHNNPFIIKNIITALCHRGARPAQSGEFSRQAVENNKIDIIQAEAINELIHANSQRALAGALAQVGGTLSSFVIELEKKLIKMLAFSEASFEFLDDEQTTFASQIKELLIQVIATITLLKKTFDLQKQLRDGIKIAFLGSVNAGKSSLFNTLLGINRAIVTDRAGTTRDAIEAGRYKDNQYQTFIDTAGLRHTDDVVERMGIEKSHECAAIADIIFLVFDSSRLLTPSEEIVYQELIKRYSNKIIKIGTKSDMPCLLQDDYREAIDTFVSTSDRGSLVELENILARRIHEQADQADLPFLLNQRHYERITALEKQLVIIQGLLIEPIAYELVSHHLKQALSELAEFTGKTISERGMDAVFRQFCVGK